MTTRRQLLQGALASGLGLSLPRRARAEVSAADRKFLFVFAQGGWDPTRVLAPMFDSASVDMEPSAARSSQGDLSWVSHPDRPSVDAFFEAEASRSVVFNGVMVRSIAHDICTMLALTGTTSGLTPDWPAILGAAAADAYTLPHLVMSGPSFPGDLGTAVARTGTNGQLEALLSGEIVESSDLPTARFSGPVESLLDRYLARRSGARAQGARAALEQELATAFDQSVQRAIALKDLRYTMDFSGAASLEAQGEVAIEALSLGVSRCVTLASPVVAGGTASWDTHADNDDEQSPLWEDLFAGLGRLVATLRATPGVVGDTLADETVLVVLSEMGRTPRLNAFNGKDHWPYTSVLVWGDGLDGGRTVGEYDDEMFGLGVDPDSTEASATAQLLSAEAVGATLLALGDVDPDPYVSGVKPIEGLLT